MSFNPSGGAVGSLSAGTTNATLGSIIFSNLNGVTFGLEGNTMTASAAGGAGLTNINYSAGTTSNNLSNIVWSNSNGISFGLNGSTVTATVQTNYLTTAMLSNAATISNIKVSGGTSSANLSAVTFANLNGISFGLDGSVVTGSHNAITTGRASNDAVGLNTALTANGVSMTANSSGLSLNFPAFLTTAALSNHSHGNPTLALTNLTGTTASASNGFTLSLSAAAAGAGSVNFSGGTTSNNLGTIVFSNSNGVSFGLNGSTMTASVNAAGGGATLSRFHIPDFGATTIGAPINASASIVFVPMKQNVSGTRLDIMGSVSVASAANTSSAGLLYTMSVVIHTKNGLTLSSLSSATTAATHNWQSNSTGSMSGVRIFTVPININATPGNYYVAVQLSTRATGHSGAATTSLGNTISLYGVATAINGAFTINSFGVATNSTTGWFIRGMNSSTGNLTQISLSNITVVGTQQNRANIALRIEA